MPDNPTPGPAGRPRRVPHERTWTWTWAPRSRIGPTCPDCQTIHGSDAAVAVDRFRPGGPRGYRSRLGGPVRRTRGEAHTDFCISRRALAATSRP